MVNQVAVPGMIQLAKAVEPESVPINARGGKMTNCQYVWKNLRDD